MMKIHVSPKTHPRRAGIMAEPTKRIQELLEENAMLKERLRSK